jgi:predicted Rossmann fold flavoprotein
VAADDVLVIGGGAAGLIAAWRAASRGARTRLLEKNPRLGLKIHISGGGKCNITHAGSMEALRRAFAPNEARFLNAAFRAFTNEDVLTLLHAHGVTTHARADGRVFPDSGRAPDVVDSLERHAREAGAKIEPGSPVSGLLTEGGRVVGARCGDRLFPATRVIVAVGGSSYSKTGTTGDGFRWAQEVGHTIVPLRAALAPIYLRRARPEYSGVALRDCVLRARAGKEIARWRGDLLFTHHGISGPCALGVSRAAALALETGEVTVEADLAPDDPPEALAAVFTAAHAGGRRSLRSLLPHRLPDRLQDEALARAGIAPETPAHQLPRRERNRLVELLKRWDLGPVREVPLERGEVTAGGVALDEVDPQTMRSLVAPGLYLCGEVLDIAGPVGGYNLQAAFSTGFLAGGDGP